MRHWLGLQAIGACVLTLAACSGATHGPTQAVSAATAAPPGAALRISGHRFVDSSGHAIRLLGVNRSGTEYACVQGWGIFDGPSDATSITAMTSWRVNAVRVPLNEDCWLGINGVKAQYAGIAYRSAIKQYVRLLHQAGLAAILDLHWAAPGSTPATQQLPMADADHAPSFWASVADAFKTDDRVAFDLYNEPFISPSNAVTGDPWSCWLHGCAMRPGSGISGTWRSAGMQALLDAVRSAGAHQPVLAGGLAWSSDLSGWASHRPIDPQHQVAASFHLYNFAGCSTQRCWDAQVAPVAAVAPVVTGELGEDDCAGGFINGYMGWADAHGVSYLGWTWDTWPCGSGPALISSYSGTPTGFGAALRSHLRQLAPPTFAPAGATP